MAQSGRIWPIDQDTDLSPADVVVFEYTGKNYAFRANMDIEEDVAELQHQYNVLRTRPTAAEAKAEIERLEAQAKQRRQSKNKSKDKEYIGLMDKVSQLQDICATLVGILAERKGVDSKHICQLLDIKLK